MNSTLKKVTSAASRTDADMLSIIGVNTSRAPALTNYPKKFNQEGFGLWKSLLEDASFQKTLQNLDAANKWFRCVQRYLRDCETEGIFPFSSGGHQANNDTVISFLTRARMQLRDYYRDSDFFNKGFSVYKVNRAYKFQEGNFTVTVAADVRPGFDPTLEKWLTQMPLPRLQRVSSDAREYRRHLQAHVDVFVRYVGKRLIIGYSVFCHTVPTIYSAKRVPTRTQMINFVEKEIWLPVVRAHRIEGKALGRRLF